MKSSAILKLHSIDRNAQKGVGGESWSAAGRGAATGSKPNSLTFVDYGGETQSWGETCFL